VTVARRLRSLLGEGAVSQAPDGVPRAAPSSASAAAQLLTAAAREGWRVRVEGAGTWIPCDAPADVALTTRALAATAYLNPGDLVTTVEAGVRWADLRRASSDHGAWVAFDPPGGDERTVGSVVATGTPGPLSGFGQLRDHVLGLTLVTGDGRTLTLGGRVMKNVAGFDLTKLAAGSYGAFGVITAVTFRLRALPRADLTLVTLGPRDALLDAARALLAGGLVPAALELGSGFDLDADPWTLGVRLVGSEAEVQAARDAVRGLSGTAFAEPPGAPAATHWREQRAAILTSPVTVRLGCLPAALEAALDLLTRFVPRGRIGVSPTSGAVRWSGVADGAELKRLRHEASHVEIPMTLERAPWPIRAALGHYGAYREGVSRLVERLRTTFDPAQVIAVPL
jgi:glycolate oxidase FAD binding subunit